MKNSKKGTQESQRLKNKLTNALSQYLELLKTHFGVVRPKPLFFRKSIYDVNL